jgi:hypothetical protein
MHEYMSSWGEALVIYFLVTSPVLVWLVSVRREVSKLGLYKVRDKWVYLVASGVLSKDDDVFKIVYGAINGQLKLPDRITLDILIERMIESSIVEDKKNHKAFVEFCEKVHKLPPEAKETLVEFYDTSLFVMREHSNMLKVWMRLAQFGLLVARYRLPVFVVEWMKRSAAVKDYEMVVQTKEKLFSETCAAT